MIVHPLRNTASVSINFADLWNILDIPGNLGMFTRKKLNKGAFVEVKALGNIDAGQSDKMTAKVCEILAPK